MLAPKLALLKRAGVNSTVEKKQGTGILLRYLLC